MAVVIDEVQVQAAPEAADPPGQGPAPSRGLDVEAVRTLLRRDAERAERRLA